MEGFRSLGSCTLSFCFLAAMRWQLCPAHALHCDVLSRHRPKGNGAKRTEISETESKQPFPTLLVLALVSSLLCFLKVAMHIPVLFSSSHLDAEPPAKL
jgi:hypothetical protein